MTFYAFEINLTFFKNGNYGNDDAVDNWTPLDTFAIVMAKMLWQSSIGVIVVVVVRECA